MKVNFSSKSLGLLLGLSLASGAALAAPVVGLGSFSASSTLDWSTTTFDFGLLSLPPPGDQIASIQLPATGVFSYLAPSTQIGISNFSIAEATVTSTNINFDGAVPDWVTLPADTSHSLPGIDLSLTDIPINTAIPVCTGTAADNTVGTSCRPYATSPFVLKQTPGSVTAALTLEGDAYYVGGSPSSGTLYIVKLSQQFTGIEGTITGLLATFTTDGSVSDGFSATFSTLPATSTVPEPGTAAVFGVGLLLIGLITGKKRIATKNR